MSSYSTWRKSLKERGLWAKRDKYRGELEKLRAKEEQEDGEDGEDEVPTRTGTKKAKAPETKAAVARNAQSVIRLQAIAEVTKELELTYQREAELLADLRKLTE